MGDVDEKQPRRCRNSEKRGDNTRQTTAQKGKSKNTTPQENRTKTPTPEKHQRKGRTSHTAWRDQEKTHYQNENPHLATAETNREGRKTHRTCHYFPVGEHALPDRTVINTEFVFNSFPLQKRAP